MNIFLTRHLQCKLLVLLLSSALTGAVQAATVNAICSTDQSWCEMAAQAFTKATGVTVLQTRKATGEALAQIRAEAANPKTDIWWGGTGDPFLQAAEMGLLTPYRPAYINDLYGWSVRQYAMSENKVGGFYTSAIGFGWNTELLKKKNLPAPKCWSDLLKPIYKGEIETSHRFERYGLHHLGRFGATDGRGRRVRLHEKTQRQRHAIHPQWHRPSAQCGQR
jgi:iron(III) transport system substrate-binding protein